ncbi:hypothetical protein ES704_02735 [subsurface metagenome]|jgi:hypothetical protein
MFNRNANITLNYDIIPLIKNAIKSIENEYQHNQGLILTESDLASLIYCHLRGLFLSKSRRNYSGMNWRMRTQDSNVYASPVHLEAPWYDDDEKLTIRPDITILEPSQLSILHRYRDGFRLPSKQFEFAGNAIIMELKFVRYKSGVTIHALEEIIRDFDKIENLRRRRNTDLMNSLYCFFVIFNKTDNRCSEFDDYLFRQSQGEWFQYVYGSGKVTFKNIEQQRSF